MADATTLLRDWLEDVQSKGKTTETEREIKDIEQLLRKSAIEKIKFDLETQRKENEDLRKRLREFRKTHDDDDDDDDVADKSVPQKYRENRTIVRQKAQDAINNPTVLKDLFQKIFRFCLHSAIQQITDLKNILHPADQSDTQIRASPEGGSTIESVKHLNKMKELYPNIVTLQKLTMKESLANVIKTFYSNEGSKLPGSITKTENGKKNVERYIDSCIDLSWDICSSYPVLYFVWEVDTNEHLFNVDGEGGDPKVVWPALVQVTEGGYKKLVKGLLQSKMDEKNGSKGANQQKADDSNDKQKADTNTDQRIKTLNNVQTSKPAVVSTSVIHVPKDGRGNVENVTESRNSTLQKQEALQKINEKAKRESKIDKSPGKKSGENITTIKIGLDL